MARNDGMRAKQRIRSWRRTHGVWLTTGGKDHFTLVPRWRLVVAAFSRKDVRL